MGEAVISEVKLYGNCLHHIPYSCADLVGGLITNLLQRAAYTGRLSDMRALYLAPRIILAPLHRVGIKHSLQLKSVIRDRIAQWPNFPPPQPHTQRKRRRKCQATGTPATINSVD